MKLKGAQFAPMELIDGGETKHSNHGTTRKKVIGVFRIR